jgi:hypothetical protein
MATQADVRRIALSFPEAVEAEARFAFSVPDKKGKQKGFAWVWMERVIPKKPRVANPAVLAVRVANLTDKDLIISAEPAKFFTEPHYDGFPAILVRLAEVPVPQMRQLLKDAWRTQARKELLEAGKPAVAKRAATTRVAAKKRKR